MDHPSDHLPPQPSRPPTQEAELLNLEPVPALLARARAELAAEFDFSKPMRVSRAPGRLDVMGGIADYTGSLVCEATLDRAAAVLLQERSDRNFQIFSFNLLDENKPFTFVVPIAALALNNTEALRKELQEPGRRWGGYLAGCLHVLHMEGYIDLLSSSVKGLNLALLSTVPLGSGVSSSAAIEVATMINLIDHFGIARVGHETPDHSAPGSAHVTDRVSTSELPPITAFRLAEMCQRVENTLVGAPCGIMDQVSSCYGIAGTLLRMVCQPHELRAPLHMPAGVRAIGINSNVRHSVGGGQYGRTRCAAFMAHKIILERIRQMGIAGGHTLVGDPMHGYLANLDPDDYKNFFRPAIPESVKGGEFLMQHGSTIDKATRVEPDYNYAVRQAADHHVLEARRVRNFCDFLEQAGRLEQSDPKRKFILDKAGHMMYASHQSYTMDALLGADECDLLVKLVRDREHAGLYGAKITGGGSGGTVAVLCDESKSADDAIAEIMLVYEQQTGETPEAYLKTSPGAWWVGTKVV